MKGPRYRALKFAISAKLLPQKKPDCSNWTCNIWCTKKKNGSHSNHIDQFYKLFCRAHKFAYAENAPLANNRISNVWIMVSQRYKQKIRQFLFSIAPNQPAWPQICAADHRGLNVVTIYFMFFLTRFVGKHCPLLSRVLFFPSFEQIFKWFCRTLGNNNKKIEKKTARWERSSGKQNKWNNYTVRYWIELNMHTDYYLLLLLLLYYFYFERRTRKKSTLANQQCARWPLR